MDGVYLDAAADFTIQQNSALAQKIDIAVMKKAMDTSKEQGQQLLASFNAGTAAMERAIQPHLGANIDVRL